MIFCKLKTFHEYVKKRHLLCYNPGITQYQWIDIDNGFLKDMIEKIKWCKWVLIWSYTSQRTGK